MLGYCVSLTPIGTSVKNSTDLEFETNFSKEDLVHPSIERIQKQATGITIIIPVHNEELRLLKCLSRTVEFAKSQQWDYELIVVEDGSTDGTVNLVKDFMLNDNRIKLISNKDRLGKGRAIRNGIGLAEKDYIGYMDADLSADPSEFTRLLMFVDKYDIAVGSRILRGELPPIDRPYVRTFLSYCYSRLFRILFKGVGVYDPQCGLKLFTSHAARVLLTQVETSGFAFDCEVIVKGLKIGLTMKEVPIIWKHDYGSKVRILREIIVMGKDLLHVWFKTKVIT
jgi:glycosyltransferase involved in cell wall biosynthesis